MISPVITADHKRIERIAGVGSWTMDLATGQAEWSAQACRIYGFDENDNKHSYQEWEAFVHPNDVAQVREILCLADIQKNSCSFQHRIINRRLEVRDINTSFEYVKDEIDCATCLVGVVQDITDLVKIKSNFSRSEENMQLVFNLIPLSVYARRRNGDYLFGNHVFLAHYGITAEQLKGKNLADFVTVPEELAELRRQDAMVFDSGKKLMVTEFKQKNASGKVTYWRILKIPFIPVGESEMAMLGIAEDITLEKERIDKIVAYSSAIKERNKQLEDFSFKVSHELRGPLTIILGIAHVADLITPSSDQLSFFLDGVKSSVIEMDKVVRELNELIGERPSPFLPDEENILQA